MKNHFIFLILLFILIFSPSILASNLQYGEIKFTVINSPPIVKSIAFSTEKPYSDTTLRCFPEIYDESPNDVSIEYLWYINGERKENNKKEISGFKESDLVRCEILLIDIHGEKGDTKSAEIKILETPIQVKIIKHLVNLVDKKASIQEVKESIEMPAITGSVIGGSNNPTVSILISIILFLTLLIGLNSFIVITKLRKKLKYPKQDF